MISTAGDLHRQRGHVLAGYPVTSEGERRRRPSLSCIDSVSAARQRALTDTQGIAPAPETGLATIQDHAIPTWSCGRGRCRVAPEEQENVGAQGAP